MGLEVKDDVWTDGHSLFVCWWLADGLELRTALKPVGQGGDNRGIHFNSHLKQPYWKYYVNAEGNRWPLRARLWPSLWPDFHG